MSRYWQRQTNQQPLYPQVEWNRPEQRTRAGRLGIVGGNAHGFAAVAEAYGQALRAGAGQARVLLPDALRGAIPTAITDTAFAASTSSGGLARGSQEAIIALGQWSDGLLLIGDAGRNSQTAIAYEAALARYHGPLTISRDAIDLIQASAQHLMERPETVLVLSFSQLQRWLRALFYPTILSFRMQLSSLVDTLHKVTITYPVTLVTFHADHLLLAQGGQVISQAWDDPLPIWRGLVATRIASYRLWEAAPLAASAAAVQAGPRLRTQPKPVAG